MEAENPRERALQKLRAKNCDWIVLNAPTAIGSERNSVELIGSDGRGLAEWSGAKSEVAGALLDWLGDSARTRRIAAE